MEWNSVDCEEWLEWDEARLATRAATGNGDETDDDDDLKGESAADGATRADDRSECNEGDTSDEDELDSPRPSSMFC